MIALMGCDGSSSNKSNISYTISGDTIDLSLKKDKNINISLLIADENLSFSAEGSGKYSIISIISQESQYTNEIALAAAKNNNSVSAKIKVADLPDTTIMLTFSPLENGVSSKIIGNCSPLVSKSDDPNFDVNMKKWLFRKGEHLSESIVNNFLGIAKFLNKNSSSEFVASTAIPVIKSFLGNTFSVTSNMIADHYVLFACSTQNEIDNFVEEVVSNDFELTSKSLSGKLNCFRPSNASGYRCITLLGINNDWSYQQQPLGLIAIDNIPPSEIPSEDSNDMNQICLKNDVIVHIPSNKPAIYGNASISIPHWDGNALNCNVTFRLSFSGDVKSFIIKRTHELCYYSQYLGYDTETKPEKKIIMTKGITSPYTFTYKLHFGSGDNLIPYEIEDYHGNKVEGKLNVRAEFVRNNSPIIENNIDIYN